MFKKVVCVGIEKREWKDKATGAVTENWYIHCNVVDSICVAGHCVFSAKIPPELVAKLEVGKAFRLAYTSYNGYNKVVEVF